MILLSEIARRLEKFLLKKDFARIKILVHVNFKLEVLIFTERMFSGKKLYAEFCEELAADEHGKYLASCSKNLHVMFNGVSLDEMDDPYYEALLSSEGNIEWGARRRLESVLGKREIDDDVSPKTKIPVITFYSYKGGMGRTTTTMAYAMHLSMHLGKRVAIIDGDLEAPGYLNFFDLSKHKELKSGKANGLVEFFCDSQFVKDPDVLKIDDYAINVNAHQKNVSDYRDIQNIWIVPAGNLNDVFSGTEEHPYKLPNSKDYLEGLSRINLSNISTVKSSFELLFEKLQEAYHLDVILLDSRTGFNDVFGTAAFYLSSCVIGFYGVSMQTLPGLGALLRDYYDSSSKYKLMLIHSILPPREDSEELKFMKKADGILNDLTTGILDKSGKNCFVQYLHRNSLLETIGTNDDSSDKKFIQMVRDKLNPDYVEIFNDIDTMCGFESVDSVEKSQEKVLNPNVVGTKRNRNVDLTATSVAGVVSAASTIARVSKPISGSGLAAGLGIAAAGLGLLALLGGSSSKREFSAEDRISFKMTILKHLNDDLASVLKQDRHIDNLESIFFYREWMKSLFDPKKIVFYGNAGSGKTFLYNNLCDSSITDKIWNCQKHELGEFVSLFVKGMHAKDFENVSSRDRKLSREQADFFTSDIYWLSCLWLTFYEDERFQNAFQESSLRSDYRGIARNVLLGIPFGQDEIRYQTEMLNDLALVDDSVNSPFRGDVFVMYDNLDAYLVVGDTDLVVPEKGLVVSSLIDFWRDLEKKKIFKKIHPKIFVTSDLYDSMKMSGGNESICLNWYLEEIFAFLTHLILCREESRNAYISLLAATPSFDDAAVTLKRDITRWKDFQQFTSVSRNSAKKMGEVLFGKRVLCSRADSFDIDYGSPWEYFGDLISEGSGTEYSLLALAAVLGRNAIDYAIKNPSDNSAIVDGKVFTSEKVMQDALSVLFERTTNKNRFFGIKPLLDLVVNQKMSDIDLSSSLSERSFMKLCSKLVRKKHVGDEYSYVYENDVKEALLATGIVSERRREKELRYEFSPFFVKTCELKNPWKETISIQRWSKKHGLHLNVVEKILQENGIVVQNDVDTEISLVDYEVVLEKQDVLSRIKGWNNL